MLVFAKLGFAGACAVVQANPNVFVFIRKAKSCVLNARRANSGTGDDFRSILESADALAGREFSFDACAGDQNVCAEAAGLAACAVGHFGATDAVGESEIVFNFGAAACLS